MTTTTRKENGNYSLGIGLGFEDRKTEWKLLLIGIAGTAPKITHHLGFRVQGLGQGLGHGLGGVHWLTDQALGLRICEVARFNQGSCQGIIGNWGAKFITFPASQTLFLSRW